MWLLAVLACDGAGDPCAPSPSKGDGPTLEIGLGVGGFTPIGDGTFPLVHGPQGGFHLEIGLLATGLDTGDPAGGDLVTGALSGVIDGQTYAETAPWLEFVCDEAAGGLVSYGTRLIYDATPEFLDGKVTEVHASVSDLRGVEVAVDATFTIRDDP
ncbi:MAG: hypothetical protein ABMB14_09350 [Myxococcota bacterium]